MLGLFIGIVVALLIFVVQEIRGNIARKKLREDISKDFERKLPVMIDIAWKTKYPDRPIPPRAKRIFEGVIKRTSTAIANYTSKDGLRFGGEAGTIIGGPEGEIPATVYIDPGDDLGT